MQNNLGIGVARQVVIPFASEFVFELLIVGQLAVKAEAEPLVLVNVLAFERLSIVAVVLTTCRIANVTDGRRADQLLHDRFVFASVG